MLSGLILGNLTDDLLDWFRIGNPDKDIITVRNPNVITWPYYALGAALAYVYLKGAKS